MKYYDKKSRDDTERRVEILFVAFITYGREQVSGEGVMIKLTSQ